MKNVDNNTVLNLQLFDDILKYLVDLATYSNYKNILEIDIHKTNLEEPKLKELNGKTYEELYDDIFLKKFRNEKSFLKLQEAIKYLESKKLITVINETYIKITFKGIIKFSNGFVNTYNLKTLNDQRLRSVEDVQKYHLKRMTILTSLIAFGTVIASIYYFCQLFSVHLCLCKL